MSIDETQKKLNDYFTEKLETFGATAKGVDYNGEQAQQIRFAELVKVINPVSKFSVIDYGSGYGAMFEFLNQRGWDFEYYGVDLIEKMVIAGREKYKAFPNTHFTTDEKELPIADYLVAAGIFNIKLEAPYDEWQNFVCETLPRMNALCSRGFSFNMLTKYSDADRMAQRPDLFYGDPLFFFDFCKRNFSRNVALLHDYGLYDFTILVRKDI
ncbi:MAG: class I SAM-dependent methyltransferase [Chloroflexi bacterium]|nr:class I SAM-dependent methyltransferase [Chloroflexota bacterium]